MNTLRLIGLTCRQMLRQIWLLPQTITDALRLREQRALLQELEAERLDRIRHPEKYRGR